MMMALLDDVGAEVLDLGRIPDDADALRAAIGRAVTEADAVVTSGGVSMGDYDVTKLVLRDEVGIDFMQVAMKPGKPTVFGWRNRTFVFGLPGNPVSVMVTYHVFVEPALRALAGHARVKRRTIEVRAAENIHSPERLTHFFRVCLEPGIDGGYDARLTGPQGSGILSSMVSADALAIVPEGRTGIERGEVVEVIPLQEWIA